MSLAAVFHQYGGPEVVRVKKVPRPVPKDNEVLVRIHAGTMNSGDVRMRACDPPIVRLFMGLFKPNRNILGVDMAGVVEAVGSKVTRFKVGDQVFGSATDERFGAHAEYKCMPESGVITHKPSNLSMEETASLFFGGNTALEFLEKKGKLKAGQRVLIYGASGAVGAYSVQFARHLGAEVHGVCSGKNAQMVRELGASRVFDYTQEDFSKSGIRYDIIFDTVGKSPFKESVESLKSGGRFLRAVHMSFGPVMAGIMTGIRTDKKVIGGVATETLENLERIRELAEQGALKPVIDRTYDLEEIVEAHRYVDSGRKRGSVVIKMD